MYNELLTRMAILQCFLFTVLHRVIL